MGGDSFQGTQKLTNQQFITLVPEILSQLESITLKAESYIPMPQKQVHGDIDILLILKPQAKPLEIIEILKIQRYIMNNNSTINSVYKNKQVDFCIVKDEKKFQIMKVYKSYSGFGAHLGIFLKSREIKLSDQGLYALGYHEHIKFQFLLTDSVEEIFQFYGLDFARYKQGFNNRKDLFQYLRGCRFTNQKVMVEHDCKNQSKLTKFFTQYLKTQQNIRQTATVKYENHLKETLEYFKKYEQFNNQFQERLALISKKQSINKKFNAVHIIQKYKIQPKQVNKLKQKFKSRFKDEDDYGNYIENTSLELIFQLFEKVVLLPEKEKTIENGSQGSNQQKGQEDPENAKNKSKQIKLQAKKQKRKDRRAKENEQKQKKQKGKEEENQKKQSNENSSEENKVEQNETNTTNAVGQKKQE